MSVIGAATAARSSQPASPSTDGRRHPAARGGRRRRDRRPSAAFARCAKWCFHSTRPSGRTRELKYTPRSALRRVPPPSPNDRARSTSSSREAQSVGPAKKSRICVGPAFGSTPGVMSMTTSSRTRSGTGCRDRRGGQPAERLPDEQLRRVGPRVDAGGDIRARARARRRRRRRATTSRRDRAGRSRARAGRARGSSCPRCGR